MKISKKIQSHCFIVEKFQTMNIGEAVKIYRYFQNQFETWRFFLKNFDKKRLKLGKIKMSEFQKMNV